MHDAYAHASALLAAPSPSADPATSRPRFDWARAWYPLAPLSYLEPAAPSAHTLLGRALAVWHSPATREWVAFEDRCPHRLAPLSEGRVVAATSTLQCSYHGFEFDACGACVRIPQADSPSQERAACASRRSRAVRYPTREAAGLLWVWLDPSNEGAGLAAAAAPALPSEMASGEGVLLGDWMMRELPLSYEFLAENLLDPAHVHFSHHGVIGSRARAGPVALRPRPEGAGFSMDITANKMQAGATSVTHFAPPCLTW
jgi:phenylpropionate dioxygenase-like ring-hydroxylating dioxygenase large terminal subunit